MLRFAQSPIDDLNIGNLRVAIFNYIMSKKLNEKLFIRIEDTNNEKNIEGKDKETIEILNLFSIEYDSIAYQSDNLKYHQKLAMQLLSQKKAFSCFCSNDKLEELKEEAIKNNQPNRYDGFCSTLSDETVLNCNAPFTIRIKAPKENIEFKDVLKGNFSYTPFEIDSFIILREDKTPIYNYACSLDDMLYDISLVIRSEEHISNTPKQIHIRKLFGYDKEIKYIHLPVILDARTGKKFNKEDKACSVKWLINEGFLPSAIANYLVLIGNKTPKEIFTLEEAIEWFEIENISKRSAKFNIDKLRFINRKHLEIIDELRLSKLVGFSDVEIGKLCKLYLEEASTIIEMKDKLNSIFNPKSSYEEFENEFLVIKTTLQTAPFFEEYEELKEYISQETSLKGEKLLKPLRYILTGEKDGPNIADIYPLIKNYLGEIVK